MSAPAAVARIQPALERHRQRVDCHQGLMAFSQLHNFQQQPPWLHCRICSRASTQANRTHHIACTSFCWTLHEQQPARPGYPSSCAKRAASLIRAAQRCLHSAMRESRQKHTSKPNAISSQCGHGRPPGSVECPLPSVSLMIREMLVHLQTWSVSGTDTAGCSTEAGFIACPEAVQRCPASVLPEMGSSAMPALCCSHPQIRRAELCCRACSGICSCTCSHDSCQA